MNLVTGFILSLFIVALVLSLLFAIGDNRPLKDRVYYFIVSLVVTVIIVVLLSMTGVIRVC